MTRGSSPFFHCCAGLGWLARLGLRRRGPSAGQAGRWLASYKMLQATRAAHPGSEKLQSGRFDKAVVKYGSEQLQSREFDKALVKYGSEQLGLREFDKALVRGFTCLHHNVAALLMDYAVPPRAWLLAH